MNPRGGDQATDSLALASRHSPPEAAPRPARIDPAGFSRGAPRNRPNTPGGKERPARTRRDGSGPGNRRDTAQATAEGLDVTQQTAVAGTVMCLARKSTYRPKCANFNLWHTSVRRGAEQEAALRSPEGSAPERHEPFYCSRPENFSPLRTNSARIVRRGGSSWRRWRSFSQETAVWLGTSSRLFTSKRRAGAICAVRTA